MSGYKYVFLDWDGNLAMTLNIWLEALRVPLEKRGHFFTDSEIGADYQAFKQRFDSWGHSDSTAIIEEARQIAYTNIPIVELYPGVIDTLHELHKTKGLALITTSRHQTIDPLLKKYEIDHLFDTVICSDDTENVKPHPEPILKALAILKADPRQVVMVGDSDNDIKAAVGAGVDSVLFYPKEHDKFHDIEYLRGLMPTFEIHSFRKLLEIVD